MHIVRVSLLVFVFSVSLFAAVPPTLFYQGRLTDANGNAIDDGFYQVRFRIYDVPTAGVTLWDNGFRTITLADGVFSSHLGDSTAFPPTLFDTPNLWLGITVGNDQEIKPRTALASVAFAQRSASSDVAKSVAWQNITGVPSDLLDGDSVGIGDITGVTAGVGLTGGGTTGDLALSVANNAVTGEMITDGTISLADINPNARFAAGRISLISLARDCASAPTPLDSFTVTVPAAGYLFVTINGRYLYNIDASTTNSITEQINLGVDTLAGVLGANSFDFYHLDPDNASSANMVWPFTLTRLDAVVTGPKKYYINARTNIIGTNLSLYSGSHAAILFVPEQLTVTKP